MQLVFDNTYSRIKKKDVAWMMGVIPLTVENEVEGEMPCTGDTQVCLKNAWTENEKLRNRIAELERRCPGA